MPKKFKKSGIAPLVETDIHELGDKRLDATESCEREREDLLKVAATRRIWGQAEQEDVQRSLGPRLHCNEIIRRIRNINPAIQVLDCRGGTDVALYLPKRRDQYNELDHDPSRSEFFWHHRYVGGFPKQELPEWGHVLLDTSRLPEKERRGWRTVLIGLIKAGAITYPQAIKAFGEPLDKRAWMWHEQLRPHKQF